MHIVSLKCILWHYKEFFNASNHLLLKCWTHVKGKTSKYKEQDLLLQIMFCFVGWWWCSVSVTLLELIIKVYLWLIAVKHMWEKKAALLSPVIYLITSLPSSAFSDFLQNKMHNEVGNDDALFSFSITAAVVLFAAATGQTAATGSQAQSHIPMPSAHCACWKYHVRNH